MTKKTILLLRSRDLRMKTKIVNANMKYANM